MPASLSAKHPTPHPMQTFIRRLLWFSLALVLLALAVFANGMRSTFDAEMQPVVAVVFTGQFSRVEHGLALLAEGRVAALMISGVNPRAGMTVQGFADQFRLDDNLRAALRDGRLVLGPRADNTLENAFETRCWLAQQPARVPVVLITSARHMPRAALALWAVASGRPVLRLVIAEDDIPAAVFAREFLRFTATLPAMAWRAAWADDSSHTCD